MKRPQLAQQQAPSAVPSQYRHTTSVNWLNIFRRRFYVGELLANSYTAVIWLSQVRDTLTGVNTGEMGERAQIYSWEVNLQWNSRLPNI